MLPGSRARQTPLRHPSRILDGRTRNLSLSGRPQWQLRSPGGHGPAFALLFQVANREQRAAIYRNTHISSAGIPCLYPSFERYVNPERTSYGRHSGTVWPHIEAFWGHAAARDGQMEIFANELDQLTAHAWRDKQFVEVYHPDTGLPYGGIQESNSDPFWQPWPVFNRQSWSASGYVRLILLGMF